MGIQNNIYQSRGWTLESWGNGMAYVLRRTMPSGDSLSALFQGDDANEFRARFDSIDDPVKDLFFDYWDIMQPDEKNAA